MNRNEFNTIIEETDPARRNDQDTGLSWLFAFKLLNSSGFIYSLEDCPVACPSFSPPKVFGGRAYTLGFVKVGIDKGEYYDRSIIEITKKERKISVTI